MENKIIIIGGGASALMLAALLPKGSALVLEHNSKSGAKIEVSGGGKCNITNTLMDAKYYRGESTFIAKVLKRFNQKSLLQWLKRKNFTPIIRKETQYFCPNSSMELLDILRVESKKQQFAYGQKVENVLFEEGVFKVQTQKKTFHAQNVVIASGGMSFSSLGATSIGYDVATSVGHTVVKIAPALVGFTVQKEQFFFKALSGLSTDVKLKVGNEICSGALLFTHKGLSGPAILDASLYWDKGSIEIDFLPTFKCATIRESKKQLSSLLPLPKRLTKAFLLQLNLEDKAGIKVTPQELEQLEQLHHYTFSPAGTFGYTKAEATKGGVSTKEIDVESMMSNKVEGLYFIGEVLDVTGRVGGYNFQWAFSSAYSCYKHIKGRVE